MTSFYFIKSGAVTVKISMTADLTASDQSRGETNVIVGEMKDGDFFGESVFISKDHVATASIIAQSDQVVLNVVSSDYVNVLFARFPNYAPKFFKFLGELIEQRLYHRIAERKGFEVSSFIIFK